MDNDHGPRPDFGQAIAALRERDETMRAIIDQVGPCTLVLERDVFKALAESIIHQQLAMKAARTICQRFVALYPASPFPTPADVLATPDDALRQVGLSGQKARYLKDLAAKLRDGTLMPARFQTMSDQEIVDQLVKVKGIGRWTAEMFLIFSLGRPNVLPVDDLGLRKAVQRHYACDPSPARIRLLAERWQPCCTVATWYLWRSLDLMPLP